MLEGRRQFLITAPLALAGAFLFPSLLRAQSGIHVVRQGDTLSGIAANSGIRVAELKAWNGLQGDTIFPGQNLRLTSPASLVYQVQRGDTLSGIARRFDCRTGDLKAMNGLRDDTILIGQKLRIPVSGVTPPRRDRIRKVIAFTGDLKIERGRWKKIIGHHSGIAQGNATIYDRNHRRRGMQNGLAYHFVIGNGIDSGDGEVEIGPRWKKQLLGGHVRDYQTNLVGVGICMVGNFMESRPSSRQMEAFEQLVDYLGNDLLASRFQFMVHKEVDPGHTVCPGKNFPVKAMHQRFG